MRKTKVTFSNEKLQYSTLLMRALAHPLRLKILEFIDQNGNIHVQQIYNSLKLEQSITSQHLRIMREAGVLNAKKEGKFSFYSIDYETVERAHNAVRNFLKN